MVEIMVIIRPQRLAATKKQLIAAGCPGFTCHKAMGRGKKPVTFLLADGTSVRTALVNKRVLSIMVPDSAEETVVKAIMNVNSTGSPGDGKIFVCPIESSYHVRTRKPVTEEVKGEANP